MIKKIILAYFALALCACASSGAVDTRQGTSAASGSYWVTLPGPESLVIIGATGRQLKRESEIDLAREDAARKAAMYHGVQVSFESVQDIGANFFDYYTGSKIELDYDRELEKYRDKLVFDEKRDLSTGNGGVFIRFTYPESFPGKISYRSALDSNGKPEWINYPPNEINGFMTGVGYSGKQFYLKDTFEKSCNAAAADIVSKLSTFVSIKESSSGSHNSSVIRQSSVGHLSHFLVLETWTDPRTQAVWTLAIARKAL